MAAVSRLFYTFCMLLTGSICRHVVGDTGGKGGSDHHNNHTQEDVAFGELDGTTQVSRSHGPRRQHSLGRLMVKHDISEKPPARRRLSPLLAKKALTVAVVMESMMLLKDNFSQLNQLCRRGAATNLQDANLEIDDIDQSRGRCCDKQWR